jgi:hypothetical protein
MQRAVRRNRGIKEPRPSLKPADIRVGEIYANRKGGTTTRKVLAIGDKHRPTAWLGNGKHPNEPGVLFIQNGLVGCLYISSFANWAGREL